MNDYTEYAVTELQKLFEEHQREMISQVYSKVEEYVSGLLSENVRLRAELDAERERNRWIPVGERLPENNTEVLLLAHVRSFEDWTKRRTRIFLGSHNNKTWICDGDMIFNGVNRIYDYASVTHWRPLPEPPEEQQP